MSCDEYLQIAQPYNPETIVDEFSVDAGDNFLMERTDHGINNAWTGWVWESTIGTDDFTYIFGT